VSHLAPMAGRLQPSRESVLHDERLTVIEHPLVEHWLSTLRDGRTATGEFAVAAEHLATCLLWEAARELPLHRHHVPGFSGEPVQVQRIVEPPAGVSVLRAGEVFAGPFRRLFPDAVLYHAGVRRDHVTLDNIVYSSSLYEPVAASEVWILDPMLATGGSVISTLKLVAAVFDGPVSVLSLVSAPIGVEAVLANRQVRRIVTTALDDSLNELGYIIPGLGDAGDRFFGTPAG
jgi:uracil phosphoribosyltransferase